MRLYGSQTALVALALTALAGCQGSDTVLTREEYVEQGNAICTAMNDEIMATAMEQGLDGPPEGPQRETLFQAVMTSIGDAMDELDALEGPDDMVAEMDAILADARTIETAVVAEGPDALFASEEDPWAAVNPRFEAMGLTACAEEPS